MDKINHFRCGVPQKNILRKLSLAELLKATVHEARLVDLSVYVGNQSILGRYINWVVQLLKDLDRFLFELRLALE